MFKKQIIAAAMLAVGALSAHAGDFYAGASVGATKWRLDSSINSAFDTSDVGGKLFAGYEFMPNFALEGGYVNLGKASASGNGASAEIKGDGWFVDAVGIAPINQDFSLFGKIGVVDTKIKASGSAPGLAVTDSKTSTQVKFGFGGSYNIAKNIAVRAELERYRGELENSKGDVDLLSVGVSYKF